MAVNSLEIFIMFPYGLKSGDSLPYGVVRICPAEKKVRVSAREPVASGEGQRIPAQRPDG
ncbi:protein of unknown function [Enterobacter cancerogenus]|nr:protein of unknown function [Enterobacter cancerogenus]